VFDFHVVGGAVAREVIAASRPQIIDLVRAAYLSHHAGDSVNPNSYFLRFPDKPDARIIALPAYLGGSTGVAGIKWIASFPANVSKNVPRASAVLLLNDYETGYPFACLEAAQISAARTAASAVLGAEALIGSRRASSIGVIGSGVIARNILEFFDSAGWDLGRVLIHDTVPEYAQKLAAHVGSASVAGRDEALGAELVVFATTAAAPHVVGPAFKPGQTVLNVSLRDLDAESILASHNVVDDVDHCLTANTSAHLAAQQAGNRDFIDGTLAGLLSGEFTLDGDKPTVFSPFGLGVLDLAVGAHVFGAALRQGRAQRVADFFGETKRW